MATSPSYDWDQYIDVKSHQHERYSGENMT